MFLIVAAIVATLVAVAVVLIFVVGTIRREQRGFDVTPPPVAPAASAFVRSPAPGPAGVWDKLATPAVAH